MHYLWELQQYRQWNINTFVRSADFIFKTIWAIAFLERMWYGKETTIICVKTIYLLYFEYIICHLFSYLISWTNISSNTILFIIINSVMVICRGTVCIFIWVLLVDKYICFLFFAMPKIRMKVTKFYLLMIWILKAKFKFLEKSSLCRLPKILLRFLL